jgi:hypothetical protein
MCGGIGTQTIFGDNQFEVGVVLTQFGDEAFGGIALTIVFLGAVLLDNRLGHQGNHCAPIGVNEGRAQHLVAIGHGTIAVMRFQTRRTVNLLGREIPRAIEGSKVMALNKHHLLKRFAALEGAKDVREQRTEVLGLNGVEYLAHRGITGHPLDAVDPVQIALGSFLVKGQQRGRFERKQGKGGHERIRQRNVRFARAMIGKVRKATAEQAEQGIGGQMFARLRSHHSHHTLR